MSQRSSFADREETTFSATRAPTHTVIHISGNPLDRKMTFHLRTNEESLHQRLVCFREQPLRGRLIPSERSEKNATLGVPPPAGPIDRPDGRSVDFYLVVVVRAL
jgi:hypothetical protein